MKKLLPFLGIATVAIVIALAALSRFSAAEPAETPHAPATYADAAAAAKSSTTRPTGKSFRAAVIGGMFETGFWEALAEKYEKETGVHVQLISAGPKDQLDKAFKEKGGIDLITMHASDTIINLVADGYAIDPQPWLKNDLVIVGPASDPAHIKGMTDAAAALKKVADTKSAFVVHSSIGAQDVLRTILDRNQITLDPQNLTILFGDNQRSVLQIASQKNAYTLIGRIPFRSGKLPGGGLVLMVSGDERLRRPYVVAVANPAKYPDAHVAEAKRFAAYVLKPETQAWVSEFGRGKLDDQPLFFPVARVQSDSVPPATGVILSVAGAVEHPLNLTSSDWSKLPRQALDVKQKDGSNAHYEGVPLREILMRAAAPIGNNQMHGPNAAMYVLAEAGDGYRVVFALSELDPDVADRNVIVADTRDGKSLDSKEGPLRIVIPDEKKQVRWIRQLKSIKVEAPPNGHPGQL